MSTRRSYIPHTVKSVGSGLLLAAAVSLAVAACGGGSSPAPPTAPTAPTTPAPPAVPAYTWSIAGQVVETSSRRPVGGAVVAPGWDLAAVTASDDGLYSLGAIANPPTTPYRLGVSAPGYVTRETWVRWERGTRNGVTLDVIRDAAPFSMAFYRQFVRGTYDMPEAPYAVFRWVEAPRFYVRTVDQNGRPIEPEVLTVVLDAIARAVPAFTGGSMGAAAIETGTESRPETDGWINVDIVRDPNERRTCGRSFVGRNPGVITLINDVCSCGSNKIPGSLVFHEVGHALGFFHVDDRNAVMYPFIPGNCPSGQLTAAESYHSAIAYSRPRGNVDPDSDPASGAQITAPDILALR